MTKRFIKKVFPAKLRRVELRSYAVRITDVDYALRM